MCGVADVIMCHVLLGVHGARAFKWLAYCYCTCVQRRCACKLSHWRGVRPHEAPPWVRPHEAPPWAAW